MQSTKNSPEAGFSIIELVLVIMIVGLIILLIANNPFSIALIGVSKQQLKAKEVVAKVLEDIRSQGFANLANGTTSISDPRINNLPSGAGQKEISDCPVEICTNGEQAKKIHVQVTWIESGKNHKVEATTLISEGGLK